jgi:hypothetical protein
MSAFPIYRKRIFFQRSGEMRSSANCNDPWLQTLGLLALLSGVANAQANHLVAAAQKASRGELCTRIQSSPRKAVASLLERPSSRSATIAWCDPTSCRYGEQNWRAGVAKKPGICALSGMRISPGDAIYKPRQTRQPPVNADEMILFSVVNDVAQN